MVIYRKAGWPAGLAELDPRGHVAHDNLDALGGESMAKLWNELKANPQDEESALAVESALFGTLSVIRLGARFVGSDFRRPSKTCPSDPMINNSTHIQQFYTHRISNRVWQALRARASAPSVRHSRTSKKTRSCFYRALMTTTSLNFIET